MKTEKAPFTGNHFSVRAAITMTVMKSMTSSHENEKEAVCKNVKTFNPSEKP